MTRRRHLYQCRLHPNENDGCHTANRLLGPRHRQLGIRCGPVGVDLGQVHRRKQSIVDDFRDGVQHRLEDAKQVELVFGEAHFTGPNVVDMKLTAGGTRTLTADSIFINTALGQHDPTSPGSIQ